MPQQMQIWLNGELVPPERATVSVFDHGLLYGDGVFEGIRCYNGRVFKLATHLRRLSESARAIRLTIPYSNDELDQAVRDTLRANDRQDGYIRLCVTRGVGTLGLNPLKCKSGNVFIIADTIEMYGRDLYENGMAVITASTIRNHPAALSPRIKSMNYLNNIMAKLEALDAGLVEAVMLNHEGFVAECTGDNLFIVRGGAKGEIGGGPVLVTVPLHAGILEGVTMNVVIDLAGQQGIAVERIDLTKDDLYAADEMFLTGTAAEIIPVTQVDGQMIGDGEPGPVTRKLTEIFHQLVGNDAPED